MNLKQRLKRLESGFGNNKQYCECFDDFTNQMIEGIYDGEPYENNIESLPKDWCNKCDLPVDFERIQSIKTSIELIYGEKSIGLIG